MFQTTFRERAIRWVATFQLSFLPLVFILYPYSAHAQMVPLPKMGVEPVDDLPTIRNKAEAWFSKQGEEGRKQFERWYQFNLRQVNAKGEFPTEEKTSGAFAEYLAARQAATNQGRSAAKIPSPSWAEIKPSSRVSDSNHDDYKSYPGHGRINCIRVDPSIPSHLFIGSAGGGVWKSTNSGTSWQPLMDDALEIQYLEIKDVAVGTGGRRIYALGSSQIRHTAENGGNSSPANSFFRSTDGGENWEVIPIEASAKSRDIKWARILIDPLDEMTLYAAGHGGGVNYRGLYKSTNGGTDWSHIDDTYHIEDMEIETLGSTTFLYLAAYEENSSGLLQSSVIRYKTTRSTQTGATSFRKEVKPIGVPGDHYNSHLACNQAGTIYLLISERIPKPGSTTEFIRNFQLWKSTNRAGRFRQVNINTMPQKADGTVIAARYGSFEVSPTDPQVLYVGAMKLCRSENGGVNWENVTDQTPELYVDHNDIHFVPGTGEIIWDANDSGIQQLVVGNNAIGLSTFACTRKDHALEVLQGTALSVSRDHPDHIMVGTHDNGSMLYDRNSATSLSAALKKMSSGDGQKGWVHATDKKLMLSSAQQGVLYRYTDGTSASRKRVADLNGGWEMPLINDRTNPNILYGANDHLWRSTDAGETWEEHSTAPVIGAGENVKQLARSWNGTYFYAAKGSDLYVSTNGGETFTKHPGMLKFDGHITSIATDVNDEHLFYLTTGGYDEDQILKGDMRTSKLVDLSKGLPNLPFTSIVPDPNWLGEAYAAGEYGVYFNPNIRDVNSSWVIHGPQLPNVCPIELAYDGKEQSLYAMTTGRGLWRAMGQHGQAAYPYCTPAGTTRPKDMGIKDARFLTPKGQVLFSFPSATNENYRHFEADPEDARAAGAALQLMLKPGNSTSPQRIRVWLDAGEDGNFSTTPIYEGIAQGSSDVKTINFTVPTGGHDKFRLRVGVDWQSSQADLSPCGNSYYGEFEDYIIPID